MSTTTPTTAEALAELDAATADVATAEANAQEVTTAVETGAVTDPDAVVQADSRRRFAFLRRKGAAARLEAAQAAERAAALEALDAAVSAHNGTARIRAAEDTFAAAVEAAAAAYADTLATVRADVSAITAQARAAGIPDRNTDDPRQDRYVTWDGVRTRTGAVTTPMPPGHSRTLKALDKLAAAATRAGVTGGAR